MTRCLTIDMGASSIRLIDVCLDQGRLVLNELMRFQNCTRFDRGRHSWDYDRIYRQIEEALGKVGRSGVAYASVGIDSWGVDYVLIDEAGARTCTPVAYRDARTNGEMERYFARHVSAHELFRATGIQCLPFNTLFQLFAQSQTDADTLQSAHRLLFTADYGHFWLSGVAVNERTLSSTSQMLTLDGHWWPEALNSLPLPPDALSEPVHPGTVLGPLRAEIASRTGLKGILVVTPASHDTQSAILAVPAVGDENWAYISSGTWSIIGTESKLSFAGADAEVAGLGNESGYDGGYCVQSTVIGLWLVQEIQRLLHDRPDDASLAAMAECVPAFRSLINPADPRFFNPPDMIAEIRTACRELDEPVPETSGELVRCAYDSLALLYRSVLGRLSQLTGRRFTRVHVVGGGSKAALLNRICATCMGVPVLAGPTEATALGNAMAQLIALGSMSSAAQGRNVIAACFPPPRYDPQHLPALEDAIGRFERLAPA
jgi:rhamnulokinase